MINNKNIIYLILSLGFLAASYYIHTQANYKTYVNSKFIAEEIQDSYSWRVSINYNNLMKDGEEKLVEWCLQVLDSVQAHKYIDYGGFRRDIRNQILPIADSLGVVINQYQSNVSGLNDILNCLLICKNRTNSEKLRLFVHDLERLENDHVKLTLWPIRDHKFTERADFFESGRILSREEILNYYGKMSNVEVKITDDVTSESKTIKYQEI